MLAADSRSGNETPSRTRAVALALVWAAVVLGFWFGLFVPSMDPRAPRADAIDLVGYFLPKFVYAADVGLRHALWNSWESLGMPLLGAAQPAVLYPPRAVLFALLAPRTALHAFMVGHYLLLGAGAYVALRTLRLGWAGAALGAVVVAFEPWMLHGHYHPVRIACFAWVPLVLATFVRTVERPGPGPATALAATAALLAVAGYPEYVADTGLALVALWPFLALRLDGATRRRGVVWVALAGAVALALSAPQWVAIAETFVQSARRTSGVALLGGIQADPGAYGGGLAGRLAALSFFFYVPPVAWLAFGAGLLAPRVPLRAGLLALAALAVGAQTVLRDLPPFSLFRAVLCWSTIFYLPYAALAGHGFDRLLDVVRGVPLAARRRELAGAALALATAAAYLSARSWLWLAVALGALVVARTTRTATAGVAVALAAAVAAALTWLPPGTPAGLAHRWAAGVPPYPSGGEWAATAAIVRDACGPHDAGGRVLAPAETLGGVAVGGRLRTAQAYPDSLAPARETALLERAGLVPGTLWPLDWTRLAGADAALRALDVRCAVLPADARPSMSDLGWAVRRALPDGRLAFTRARGETAGRAWVVGRGRAVVDRASALDAVFAPGFDPAREVVVEGPVVEGGGDPGVALVRTDAPGRLAVRAVAPAGGWLVVGEAWFPGWRARVDGTQVPVRPADGALMAVALTPGAHEVELWYVPRGFGLAEALGFAGGLALVAGAVATLRRR